MKHSFLLMAALFLLCYAGGVALAQTGGGYDLTWWTVDGGGTTLSGSGYALSGTAGQPDAGALSGGGYTLAGGFWVGGSVATPVPGHDVYLPIVLKRQ